MARWPGQNEHSLAAGLDCSRLRRGWEGVAGLLVWFPNVPETATGTKWVGLTNWRGGQTRKEGRRDPTQLTMKKEKKRANRRHIGAAAV